jgi:hypothetical protein
MISHDLLGYPLDHWKGDLTLVLVRLWIAFAQTSVLFPFIQNDVETANNFSYIGGFSGYPVAVTISGSALQVKSQILRISSLI